jgi:hypothetical protein
VSESQFGVEPTERVAPPVEHRNPLGWIALALLFAFLIFNTSERKASANPEARRASYSARLKTALAMREAGSNPIALALSGDQSPDDGLRELERDAAPKHRTDAVESAVWVAVRTELNESVSSADIQPLKQDPKYAPFAQVYGSESLGKPQAAQIVASLEKGDALQKLAAAHLRAKAGLPALPKATLSVNLGTVVIIFSGLVLASGFAWIALVSFGLAGELRNLGPASKVQSGAEADVFALRAATLLVAFLGLNTIVGLLGFDSRVAQLLAYGPMLAVVPLVLRRRPSMADIGLSTRKLGRDILLGLWVFLLELPVTAGVALLGALLLRNLPQPEHPATTALQNTHDLGTILVTLFMGTIVAPFWEETMFRGLLFPALRNVLRGPIPAALVSSFLFASIHPQGPVLWAALASVALFSCALAQRTRSLVPSVVMHFAHNATVLTLVILASN